MTNKDHDILGNIIAVVFGIGLVLTMAIIMWAVVLFGSSLAHACEPAIVCEYHGTYATFVTYEYGDDQKCYCIYEHPVPGGKHRIQIEDC